MGHVPVALGRVAVIRSGPASTGPASGAGTTYASSAAIAASSPVATPASPIGTAASSVTASPPHPTSPTATTKKPARAIIERFYGVTPALASLRFRWRPGGEKTDLPRGQLGLFVRRNHGNHGG